MEDGSSPGGVTAKTNVPNTNNVITTIVFAFFIAKTPFAFPLIFTPPGCILLLLFKPLIDFIEKMSMIH
jgi:hypothetical protein